MTDENTRSSRRKFLITAATGAAGVLAATTIGDHDRPPPQDKDVTADAPGSAALAFPKAAAMIIGGGDQQWTIDELRAGIATMTPDQCDSKNLFRRMIALSPRQPPVVEFITNASKHFATETGEQYQMIFKRLGAKEANFIDSRDPQKMNDPAIVARLKRADIVFITGGDQTDLEKIFRNSKALQCLRQRYIHDSGFVYAGSSAGAMIVSQDMIDGDPKMKNTPPLMNVGFGFLPVIVDTHVNGKAREQRLMHAVAGHPGSIGLGLDNGTSIIIRNGEAEVCGPGRVLVVRHREAKLALDAGRKITLAELPGCQQFEAQGMDAFCYRKGEHFGLDAYARIPGTTAPAPALSQNFP